MRRVLPCHLNAPITLAAGRRPICLGRPPNFFLDRSKQVNMAHSMSLFREPSLEKNGLVLELGLELLQGNNSFIMPYIVS